MSVSPSPPASDGARPSLGTVVLRARGLTKRFGAVTAVDGLDLDVRAGEVHGFLGPNGAGKSTTAGMILGLIRPDAGRIELLGQDLAAHRGRARRLIGAVVEAPAFYPFLSGRDNLRALALAVGGVPRPRIEALLTQVGLAERAADRYQTYSLGMRQRLGIAAALLTDPVLVILDEPTNGLDPAGQREVRALIPQLAREGHAVLLASHLLHEVEQICDRVTIIRRGRLVASGPVRELLRRGDAVEIIVEAPERAAAVLRTLPFVEQVSVDGARLTVTAPPERGADLNRALAAHGLYAAAIVPRQSTLEDVFLELTAPTGKEDGDGGAAGE
jgi:ABC-2 type transport system ATP-binding protein